MLYVILTSIGWILALFLLGQPALEWLGRRTDSYGEGGPSQAMTCTVVFSALASAWVTDRIGIHAIFGGLVLSSLPSLCLFSEDEDERELINPTLLQLQAPSSSASLCLTRFVTLSPRRLRTSSLCFCCLWWVRSSLLLVSTCC